MKRTTKLLGVLNGYMREDGAGYVAHVAIAKVEDQLDAANRHQPFGRGKGIGGRAKTSNSICRER